jgi:predicted dehydrogenase
MKEKSFNQEPDRRNFLKLAGMGVGAGIIGLQQIGCKASKESLAIKPKMPDIEGFELESEVPDDHAGWVPVSDRKIKVGIAGFGTCRFGALFEFQTHPNVEVVAVSDLFPSRCAELARLTGCSKTYPSLEELVKDDTVEAVYVATDAPSHARHCMEVLSHGKHVATAVPAVFGSLEDAEKLFEAVKKSGLKYMMFETSCYHADNHAMREIYKAGGFGKIIYAEGEYFGGPSSAESFNDPEGTKSYRNWRIGMPPQWYPTHSNAYYVGVTGGSFTEVSCMGMPTLFKRFHENNKYKNPFYSEIALMRTDEGGMARMGVSHDTPGNGGEAGRIRGQRGSYYGGSKGKYTGHETNLPNLTRPPLPPGVQAGGHGGSHGRLMNEFILSILEDRKPLVDIAMALNMTVAGIVAHQSALKDGELMKIPQYKYWE